MPNYISCEEAAALLPQVDRVLVVGCSGGGKTTLSVKLASKLGIEYQSIDRDVRWLPGWRARDRSAQRALLSALVARDQWVMDGSGASTFDIRLPRTDLILWVRVPRYIALKGIALRVIKHLGSVRPEMAEGCPEKFPDLEFLSYIWTFEKRQAPLFIKNIDNHGPHIPVVLLKSHGEISRMLLRAFQ